MLRTPYSRSVLTIGVAVFVVGAAIADAVCTNGFAPVWMVGWRPAVLVSIVYRRPSEGRCLPRIPRRAQP
jgi:hypothetical protein